MTSQINPNNIDGNYPVAGQQNNTQGFRDNFTNTKTNFQYASDEITELQSKVVLKSALSGTTLDNNMGDNILYAVQLKDVSWTEVRQTATSGSIVLNYAAGNYQVIPTVNGNVSIDFLNWPTSGTVGSMKFAIVVTNTAYTLTLPAAVSVGIKIIDGISPGTPGVSNVITFAAVGTYVYEFETADGGTTVSIQQTITPTDTQSNRLIISNTTPSTSTITGALTVAGGVGVAGNVYAGHYYGDGSTLSNIYPNYVFNGQSYIGIGTANGNANISVGSTSNVVVVTTTGQIVSGVHSVTGNITTPGNILLTDGGTMGYNAGAGGTVSQSGNKSQGVTLNKPSGEITMQNTALAADTTVSFTLTNSTIGARDLLLMNIVGGVATASTYLLSANCTTGSAVIGVRNITAGSLSEAIVIRFAVIRGSIA